MVAEKDEKPVEKPDPAKEKAEAEKKEAERLKAWEEEQAMGPFAGGPMALGQVGTTPVVFEIFSGVGGFLVVKTSRGEVKALTGDYIFVYDDGDPANQAVGVLTAPVAQAILGLPGPPTTFMTNKQWLDELKRRDDLEKKAAESDKDEDKDDKPGTKPPTKPYTPPTHTPPTTRPASK